MREEYKVYGYDGKVYIKDPHERDNNERMLIELSIVLDEGISNRIILKEPEAKRLAYFILALQEAS